MNKKTNDIHTLPPPWELRGNGFVVFYRFPKEFLNTYSLVPNVLRSLFCGGIGAMMLFDYYQTPVGPYSEILFIPGQFAYENKKYHSITRRLATSRESAAAGYAQWGIPEEKGTVHFIYLDNRYTRIRLAVNDKKTADGAAHTEITFKTNGIPLFMPSWCMPNRLLHCDGKHLYRSRIKIKTRARLCRIKNNIVQHPSFPDTTTLRPLAVLHIPEMHCMLSAADKQVYHIPPDNIADKVDSEV